MESCPLCGAVIYADDGVCEVCSPYHAESHLPPLGHPVRPYRSWRDRAAKFAVAAIPVLVDALFEAGIAAIESGLLLALTGDVDEEDDFLDEVDEGTAGHRGQTRSPGGSAVPPGRMRQTDQVKGPDSPLPNKPGIYHHINKATGEREYVGQTNDLRVRQQQHARSGKLDTDTQCIRFAVAKEGATKDDLCQTEVDHIARHHPPGNTTRGGNGRR